MEKQDIRFFRNIIVFTILLTLSLSFLYVNKTDSYSKYERIQFQSSGATLYANLYYPSKPLGFQDQRPLLIYCHGIGSQRDFDLRIPIEFTKRGYYVVALDYQGHGESGGNIVNINPESYMNRTDVPSLAQDCSKLLDRLETHPFYSNINVSQIGLIGHSLGGMVVLMNQALDPRFNITVTWAPLVNFDPVELGIVQSDKYDPYIPVNLINTSNTNNLLIIMHENDEALNFTKHALKAQELTNCTVIKLSGFLFGGNHQLFTDIVLIESINWFENYFFKSETINGPIYITFLINYIFIIISLGLLITLVYSLISYSARFFALKKEDKGLKEESSAKVSLSRSRKFIKILQIIAFSVLFVINWEVFEQFFGLMGIFFASLNVVLIYIILKLIARYIKLRRAGMGFGLRKYIKSRFQLKYFIYSAFVSAYFIIIFFLFLFSYPSVSNPRSAFMDWAVLVIVLLTLGSIGLCAFIGIGTYYAYKQNRIELEFKLNFQYVKTNRHVKVFIYALVCAIYFIVIYMIFTFSYPFAFMWPSSFVNFILTAIAFPIFLSIEILYRKVIYPRLSFLSEKRKTMVIIIIAIFIQVNLIALTWTWAFLPSVMFTYLIFLIVIIQNTVIFSHTKSFTAVAVGSFMIIQIFFAAVISNVIGIGAALHLFVVF